MIIRPALIQDVPEIGKIVNSFAEYGLMLHRSLAYLYEHVRDFVIAVDDSATEPTDAPPAGPGDHVQAGSMVGVCGLSIVWANLAEVYSLAVVETHQGRGIGKGLVEACVADARRLGIARLMTLTYEQAFFTSCGFSVVDRQTLPLKVWSDCLRCSRSQACDEIAMVHVLKDVPAPHAPVPPPPPAGAVEVPLIVDVIPQRKSRRPKMDQAP